MARDIETIRFLKYFSWLDSSSLISTVYNLLPGFTEAEEKKKKEEEEKERDTLLHTAALSAGQ